MKFQRVRSLTEQIYQKLATNYKDRSIQVLAVCISIAVLLFVTAIYLAFNDRDTDTLTDSSDYPMGSYTDSESETNDSKDWVDSSSPHWSESTSPSWTDSPSPNQSQTESPVFSQPHYSDGSSIPSSDGNLITWQTPAGMEKNNTFSVWVREKGKAWRELSVYTVKNGKQRVGDIPTDAAMVKFDFAGEVEMKVTYNQGRINEYEIRPTAYGIDANRQGNNTLIFSLTQGSNAPVKPTVMINGSWSEGNLHILTNTPEEDVPSMGSENVHVIKPGDPVPLYLPDGKDTYYFAPGVHELPKGMWVELDLKDIYELDSFDLVQLPTGSHWYAKGPQRFIIEAREKASDKYVKIYDGYNNNSEGTITGSLKNVRARYVKITLLGNTGTSNYIMASIMSDFRLYKKGESSTNIAKNTAIAGAFDFPGYLNAVDGNKNTYYISSTGYGNWHAGEAFFISQSNINVYLAPGSVVKGSISADDQSNITIRGRGFMYGGELLRPRGYAEGRSGAIWLTKGTNCTVEGITLLDYPMWAVVMNHNESPTVKNINFFGSMVNGDGIHFSGSRNGHVSGVFIRACDDNFVMYHYGPGSNIIVRDSVFWADNARPILLGLGDSRNAHIDGVTFENIYILNQRGVWDLNRYNGAIQLWPTGGNQIRNITFKNIYIDEFEVPADSSIFQIKNTHYGSTQTGSVRNIIFENVFYRGELRRRSLIHGIDGSNNINDILFKNFRINNTMLSDSNNEKFIEFRGEYGNIRFE